MIKDRYSFDEYQGYLRVATTDNANNIFVLDSIEYSGQYQKHRARRDDLFGKI